ncbi:pyridoxal 5'-phosphate synthase glutaminase subunit PdxT [Tessaracoccus sp. G1721]
MTVGILALQGAVREHAAVLERLGRRVSLVRRPDDLVGLEGLVLPGGESTAIARLARPTGLLSAIRDRADGGLPVFGTCAGLILLADEVADPAALTGLPTIGGLNVTVRRNAFGAQLASGEADVELTAAALGAGAAVAAGRGRLDSPSVPGGAHPRMRGVFIRAPRIERVGAGVEVLATRGDEPVAVRQGAVVACTFHPELVPDPTLHHLWLGGV